mmetsp:Transcript_24910/g.76989  ORF Transcript_24910/g.76989 Transcript_24910/m.76989 type:complete len:202 (-) Transcript_24910:299-904(-)
MWLLGGRRRPPRRIFLRLLRCETIVVLVRGAPRLPGVGLGFLCGRRRGLALLALRRLLSSRVLRRRRWCLLASGSRLSRALVRLSLVTVRIGVRVGADGGLDGEAGEHAVVPLEQPPLLGEDEELLDDALAVVGRHREQQVDHVLAQVLLLRVERLDALAGRFFGSVAGRRASALRRSWACAASRGRARRARRASAVRPAG